MTSDLRAELEALAASLDSEVRLATTREAHIRAAANASALRLILSSDLSRPLSA